jgi:hypothetical protein
MQTREERLARRRENYHKNNGRAKNQEYCRKVRKTNPERFTWRYRKDTLKNYNLTLEQFFNIVQSQESGCAICGVCPDENLCVDHNHKCCPEKSRSCGKCIRGLLCQDCNRGHFKENPVLLYKAGDYFLNPPFQQS